MLDSQITVATRIKKINEQIERLCNQKVRKYQITGAQMRILMAIYYTEGYTETMRKLEEIFGVSQQNILGIVQRLEEKELLFRRVNEQDHRSRKVQLTGQGLQLCRKAHEEIRNVDNWILKDLDEEEKETFMKLLTKVQESLEFEKGDRTEKRRD